MPLFSNAGWQGGNPSNQSPANGGSPPPNGTDRGRGPLPELPGAIDRNVNVEYSMLTSTLFEPSKLFTAVFVTIIIIIISEPMTRVAH